MHSRSYHCPEMNGASGSRTPNGNSEGAVGGVDPSEGAGAVGGAFADAAASAFADADADADAEEGARALPRGLAGSRSRPSTSSCSSLSSTLSSCSSRPSTSNAIASALAQEAAGERARLAEKVCDLRSSSFKAIVDKYAFVDKTLFIKNFLQAKNAVWVTAPPRFGKSTLIDMVRTFLGVQVDEKSDPVPREASDSYAFFRQHAFRLFTEEREFFERHCGQYPLIHVDLSKVDGANKSEILHSLRCVVRDVYRQYSYLVKKTDKWGWNSRFLKTSSISLDFFLDILEEGVEGPYSEEHYGMGPWKFLFEVLEKHFQTRVYVLIDNCDAPITNAMLALNEHVDWVHDLVAELIDFLVVRVCGRQALLTRNVGIYSPNRSYLSHVHNRYHPEEYSRWLGFTQEEVAKLLVNPVFSMVHLPDIARWYGGYEVYEERWGKKIQVFNPWSVLNFLQKSVLRGEPDFQLYWPEASCVLDLENLFREPKIREMFSDLLYDRNNHSSFMVNSPDVDIFEFIKLMSMSRDRDEDVAAVVYVEFGGKFGGKTVESQIYYLYMNLLLALHYSGYLNRTVRESKDRCFLSFHIPNTEILKSLLMKFVPQAYQKVPASFYVTLHHFWEY